MDAPTARLSIACFALLLAACATEPARYGEVVTMRAGASAPQSGYPAPGTVWRLDETDLQKLSPAPIVPAPPPPRLPPPPRPNDPPVPYYGPYHPPYWLWGPGFYGRYGWW